MATLFIIRLSVSRQRSAKWSAAEKLFVEKRTGQANELKICFWFPIKCNQNHISSEIMRVLDSPNALRESFNLNGIKIIMFDVVCLLQTLDVNCNCNSVKRKNSIFDYCKCWFRFSIGRLWIQRHHRTTMMDRSIEESTSRFAQLKQTNRKQKQNYFVRVEDEEVADRSDSLDRCSYQAKTFNFGQTWTRQTSRPRWKRERFAFLNVFNEKRRLSTSGVKRSESKHMNLNAFFRKFEQKYFLVVKQPQTSFTQQCW